MHSSFDCTVRKAKNFYEMETEREPTIFYDVCSLRFVPFQKRVTINSPANIYFTFARPFFLHFCFRETLRQAAPIPFHYTFSVCEVTKCSAGKLMGCRHLFLLCANKQLLLLQVVFTTLIYRYRQTNSAHAPVLATLNQFPLVVCSMRATASAHC